jgi:hypothetical protein
MERQKHLAKHGIRAKMRLSHFNYSMTVSLSRLLGWLMVCGLAAQGAGAPTRFTLACSPHNDLFVTLQARGLKPERFETPAQAVAEARPGATVMLLADDYPAKTLSVSENLYREAAAKDLRLYVEFPSLAPGVTLGAPRKTMWERFVVSSDGLGRDLPKGRLLMAHECQYLPASAQDALVVVGRVAGYDTAIYGIPASAQPVLFPLEGGRVLVATTKLSGFITARFAPTREWQALWQYILADLSGAGAVDFTWQPRVGPMYGPHDRLPAGFEKKTFEKAAGWCHGSGLLVSEARLASLNKLWQAGVELTDGAEGDDHAGDGRLGILEGFNSKIRGDGSQPQRTPIRADCQAESAMVLAMDWALNRKGASRKTAANLLDFLYFNSDMCSGQRGNPKHPAFGLISWGSVIPAWMVANYGDDNARTMLATMLASACLDSDRWNEPLLRALLANLRTTGRLGFRGDRIDMPDLERQGWRYYHDAAPVNYSPHFESYLWACYLWAYAHTGETGFLDKAETGIRMMMEAFPDKWRWNDNNERARMLLCLAWLVRVEDTDEHRHWLRLVADDLISIQHESGAFPERFRATTGSYYQIPKSNEAYGTGETPLIQKNGDPVSDQLYVTGFALLGLHEAAAVLEDARIREAEDKLAEYVCRIQVRSKSIPCLAGTWFRAFDFERWEAWASSGDAGWGAWSEEAGWAQAWTAGALGLRQKKATLWEMTAHTNIGGKLSKVRGQMAENQGGPWR